MSVVLLYYFLQGYKPFYEVKIGAVSGIIHMDIYLRIPITEAILDVYMQIKAVTFGSNVVNTNEHC